MDKLLDRDLRITAVFALNDTMAVGAAIHALRSRGPRVPEDVSVIGCDDVELAPYATPPVITVRISFEAIGGAAPRLLLGRLSDPNTVPGRVAIPVELVVRGSTGPLFDWPNRHRSSSRTGKPSSFSRLTVLSR